MRFRSPSPLQARRRRRRAEDVLYSIPEELFKTPAWESEARVLDRGGDCNRRNAHGATPLHFAAAQESLGPGPEALRILVRCEADPNARDRRGRTPLHSLIVSVEGSGAFPVIRNLSPFARGFSSGGARFDVARVLLEELDAAPNVKDNDGDTPLMLMVRAINRAGAFIISGGKASLLLRHGADPNTRNDKGATLLIETVSSFSGVGEDDDSIRLIRLLLRHGADPYLRARNSDTPLIRAAKHEDDSVYEIEALLAGGADPCLRDRRGRIAHQYAEEVGAEASMEALERAGGYLSFVNSVHGFCVRDLRMAEKREKKLALDPGRATGTSVVFADPGVRSRQTGRPVRFPHARGGSRLAGGAGPRRRQGGGLPFPRRHGCAADGLPRRRARHSRRSRRHGMARRSATGPRESCL